MPSFEQDINEFRQFIIAVKVFPPTKDASAYDEATLDAAGYRALVDTGANVCSISEKIVTDLNLPAYGRVEMTTAGAPHTTSVYQVGLAIPVTETEIRPEKQEDGGTIMKPVSVAETSAGFAEMKVTSFPDIGADRGFDIILGMDMLMHFHITMHTGKIVISI